MFGDEEEYSVTERLGEMVSDKLGLMAPVWIVRRPETLTITDYRPTFYMFLTMVGFVVLAVLFIFLFFKIGGTTSVGLWGTAVFAIGCLIFSLRGTIREVYYFDKTTDSYSFVRQFIYRREMIEGSLSQFTGAYVKTESNDDSETYYVMLKQEGMFLTGVSEQTLREEVPVFNSEFLPSKS
jgi:hypothetical protein